MKYGIESKMKDSETPRWARSFQSFASMKNWRVLKWYEKKKDRDKALDALSHRSNDINSYSYMWQYRAIDADKRPKKRKAKKIVYPEHDYFSPLIPFDTN